MEEALHHCRTCTHSAQDHPRRPARPCVAPGCTCGGSRRADPIVCLDCGHTTNLHSQPAPRRKAAAATPPGATARRGRAQQDVGPSASRRP